MSAAATACVRLLTPPGAGAIAVVRVEGPAALNIVAGMFKPRGPASLDKTEPGRPRYGQIIFEGETLDDAIVCVTSRTPVCSLELCLHGGIRIVERVLAALESSGALVVGESASPADDADSQPVCNDGGCRSVSTMGATGSLLPVSSRIDRSFVEVEPCQSGDARRSTPWHPWPIENEIEREVDEALRRAKTERAVRFLAAQRRLLPTRLIELMHLARSDPATAQEELQDLTHDGPAARRLIDGAVVVFAGAPNVGKSTLFNALAGREVAVVSPVAGTTRDWVTAEIEVQGVPVTLIDTAGEHDQADVLEQLAVAAGHAKQTSADLILRIEDAPVNHRSTASTYQSTIKAKYRASDFIPELTVWNKTDLIDSAKKTAGNQPRVETDLASPVFVSALTGAGVDALAEIIALALDADQPATDHPCLFSNRQLASASRILALPITQIDALRAKWEALIFG